MTDNNNQTAGMPPQRGSLFVPSSAGRFSARRHSGHELMPAVSLQMQAAAGGQHAMQAETLIAVDDWAAPPTPIPPSSRSARWLELNDHDHHLDAAVAGRDNARSLAMHVM